MKGAPDLTYISPLGRYAAIVLCVALMAAIRLPLEPFVKGSAPYAFFYLPILISAWYWGVAPALFASALSGAVAGGYLAWLGQPLAGVSLLPFAIACAGMVVLARRARDVRSREERNNGHLAAIVRSSGDAILSQDLNGIIRACNPACERLFGYREADLLGRPVTVLIPPDVQVQEADILARVGRGESIERLNTVRVAQDGRRIDVALTLSPVRDEHGAILGASKILSDRTEIRRAESALAAQQEWLRVTLGSIVDAVVATDPEGRVTFLNQAAERLTGWDRPQAEGQPLPDVFHVVDEETRQRADDPAIQVLRTGHVAGLGNHSLLARRDGALFPIAGSAAPIRSQRGEMLGVVVVVRDVTDTRRAEDAMAEQREWFERTLEGIGDAVIATDAAYDIVFMNPVAERLTGWAVSEAVGKSCDEVFHIVNESSRCRVDSPARRVLETGTVAQLSNHTVLIARDGSERPIDDSGAPIRNRDGHVVGVVLVFRDVTERRRAERERQAASTERERLLESERHARADAERANLVKDDFLAVVSHELRTPLNSILGWASLLSSASPDPHMWRRGLEVIDRNARFQAQLIEDLLDVSRIVSGKLLLDVQEVDLASLIEEAVQTINPVASERHIAIRQDLDVSPRVTQTVGDRERLRQVFWNLLSNAIKFSPEGATIDISLRQSDSHVEIAVTDTGAGIRPELLGRIFDRFYQRSEPTTRQHGGLGLGLSIVRHLVELHGGTVHARSEGEGHGATFIVRLPHFASIPPETSFTASAPRRTPLQTLEGVRVLVVEDQDDTRELVERLLRSQGAKVAVAATAQAALAALANTAFDVLVSDIGLPEIDGYELMRRVRGQELQGCRIPAIALTAFTRPEDRTRARVAGYQVHLAKPVDPSKLIATIARLVP